AGDGRRIIGVGHDVDRVIGVCAAFKVVVGNGGRRAGAEVDAGDAVVVDVIVRDRRGAAIDQPNAVAVPADRVVVVVDVRGGGSALCEDAGGARAGQVGIVADLGGGAEGLAGGGVHEHAGRAASDGGAV